MAKDQQKKKNKHAPSETSCAAPQGFSRVRNVPGLDTTKYKTSKFGDIRFDPAFGRADEVETRNNYKFLDDYRNDEIKNINKILKDPKSSKILSYRELEDLDYEQKSLKSRMDSLKNKDMANSVKRRIKNQYWNDIKDGKKGHYLKRSEQKKLIQIEKFKSMKKKQVDKAMERKRKKTLAKEYKNVEFLKNE